VNGAVVTNKLDLMLAGSTGKHYTRQQAMDEPYESAISLMVSLERWGTSFLQIIPYFEPFVKSRPELDEA
jgi:hypothetical protein